MSAVLVIVSDHAGCSCTCVWTWRAMAAHDHESDSNREGLSAHSHDITVLLRVNTVQGNISSISPRRKPRCALLRIVQVARSHDPARSPRTAAISARFWHASNVSRNHEAQHLCARTRNPRCSTEAWHQHLCLREKERRHP